MSFFTGHDYYGRSSGGHGSLLIWTHSMRQIDFHDSFVPVGKENDEGHAAMTLQAGLTFMDVYVRAMLDRNVVTNYFYILNSYILRKAGV